MQDEIVSKTRRKQEMHELQALGDFPLPVEVLPMARSFVARQFVRPVERDRGNEGAVGTVTGSVARTRLHGVEATKRVLVSLAGESSEFPHLLVLRVPTPTASRGGSGDEPRERVDHRAVLAARSFAVPRARVLGSQPTQRQPGLWFLGPPRFFCGFAFSARAAFVTATRVMPVDTPW